MNKLVLSIALVMISMVAVAQKKKELIREVEMLKAKIVAMEQREAVDLENEYQKLSYAIGTSFWETLASNMDSLQFLCVPPGCAGCTKWRKQI